MKKKKKKAFLVYYHCTSFYIHTLFFVSHFFFNASERNVFFQDVNHDYSHGSMDEDPRMMAFFDSLVQREVEGWTSNTDLSDDLDNDAQGSGHDDDDTETTTTTQSSFSHATSQSDDNDSDDGNYHNVCLVGEAELT